MAFLINRPVIGSRMAVFHAQNGPVEGWTFDRARAVRFASAREAAEHMAVEWHGRLLGCEVQDEFPARPRGDNDSREKVA